ncbi:hypothetical protein [Formosa sp. PL04]|uniref:hypothetical protein n=1 Tax=Formosa sp. PL04 TaxID=3081755 RepID=UPI0029819F2E|nr:hypothetical protein [Formosa sp. PL04]MDW5288587.1 hypothetical protein [Formosa sp. PL04]
MKHILLCICCLLCCNMFSVQAATLNNTNTTVIKDRDKNQFNPILIDRQYISEQSQQFINQEISFVRVLEEASKFWQSDETRIERWEPRVEKYFNASTFSNYENEHIKKQLNAEQSQTDLNKIVNIITTESIAEYTTEVAILGLIWMLMGAVVVYTKGRLFVLDVVLTTVICVWFGLKNQMIKDNLEDFLVLKNTRLSEMVDGTNNNKINPMSYDKPKDLEAIRLLE